MAGGRGGHCTATRWLGCLVDELRTPFYIEVSGSVSADLLLHHRCHSHLKLSCDDAPLPLACSILMPPPVFLVALCWFLLRPLSLCSFPLLWILLRLSDEAALTTSRTSTSTKTAAAHSVVVLVVVIQIMSTAHSPYEIAASVVIEFAFISSSSSNPVIL